ncbi:hypothetical protein BCR32DRAFT_290960 [Anaeromyces robustus]|uniref:Uncharacterized protein n=1 Tax=Anaeromyces robustus TaxID=1754192 RepID=A0A1Y1XI07_9FUNG|nr:hypothetical protein BCR32DRAFT_290960 [Anaeromyces robustus]|eukprot:ORX85004.1 hypothetical protein BCR32DRAFT_290960 [Anaeromyces robustus]
MSYTPKSKLSYQAYPETNYGSSNYRTNYGSSYNNSSLNNKAMSKQLEKCWQELATGKYSSNNNRRNSATSSAIEEEVRNIYDQVALQVRRGDATNISMVSSQLNSNYSKSEKSFVNFFRVPKPPRSYGFSEASNSRILSSLQSPPMTTTNTTTTKNKMMYTLPSATAEANAYLVDNDKECMVPGMIFFIIGFVLPPFWWFASVIPLHPVTEKEFKWRKINRYASLVSIILLIGAAIAAFIIFRNHIF